MEVAFNVDPAENHPTLEQSAAAVDAAAADRAAKEAAQERPAWLPQQFKTVDDYNKSYADGRAEITRLQQELAKQKPAENVEAAKVTEPAQTPDATQPQEAKEETAKQVAEAAGVNLVPFTTEFNEKGDVSEENRTKLAEALKGQFGDNARTLVDQYIDGFKATAANAASAAYAEAGGEETYSKMIDWARTNLKEGEIAAYNKAIGADMNSALLAIRGLKASFEKAEGKTPTLVNGEGGQASDPLGPFTSPTAMKNAINDPRYATDPDYRNSVIQRTIKSNF